MRRKKAPSGRYGCATLLFFAVQLLLGEQLHNRGNAIFTPAYFAYIRACCLQLCYHHINTPCSALVRDLL
eukprot:871-Heterococcus_DN1.PRE.2